MSNISNLSLVVTSAQNGAIGTIKHVSELDLQLGKTPPTPSQQPISKQLLTNSLYAIWGDDNLDPDYYDELIGENSALSGAIQRKIDNFYAGGIEYGFISDEGVFEKKFDPIWQTFLELPHTVQYLNSAFECYVKYRAVFPQLIFNEPKTKILKFRHLPAKEVRFGLQDRNTGIITNAYWGKNWNLHTGVSDAIEYPVFDELMMEDEEIAKSDAHYFIMKVDIPGPNTYYQPPLWMPSVLQGWHKHSMQVPDWYEAMMEHITSMQFEVIFSENYFQSIYGEAWETGTTQAKLTMMQDRLENIYSSMKGTANAGKSIANIKIYNEVSSEYENGFEIKPLDFKTFSGQYLENLREADQHIIWSVGEDPISMGSHGSSGDSSAGGSGKKAAFNSDMATNTRHANIILAPFYFKKRFENHDPRLTFRIKLPFLADLNQVTPDKRGNAYEDTKPKNQPKENVDNH